MSWYDSDWAHRWPINAPSTAGGGTGNDLTLTIPADFGHFWDEVKSDGYDAVITTADGRTLTTFQRQTWDHANKSAVIEVSGPSLTAGNVTLFWLYYGNASASDQASSFTAGTTLTAGLALEQPRNFVADVTPELAGATTPSLSYSKQSSDTEFYWFNISPMLHQRVFANEGQLLYEEVASVEYSIETAGTSQPSMIDIDEVRAVRDATNNTFIRAYVTGGSDGTTYTGIVTITTTLDRVFEFRFLIEVNDPDET